MLQTDAFDPQTAAMLRQLYDRGDAAEFGLIVIVILPRSSALKLLKQPAVVENPVN